MAQVIPVPLLMLVDIIKVTNVIHIFIMKKKKTESRCSCSFLGKRRPTLLSYTLGLHRKHPEQCRRKGDVLFYFIILPLLVVVVFAIVVVIFVVFLLIFFWVLLLLHL